MLFFYNPKCYRHDTQECKNVYRGEIDNGPHRNAQDTTDPIVFKMHSIIPTCFSFPNSIFFAHYSKMVVKNNYYKWHAHIPCDTNIILAVCVATSNSMSHYPTTINQPLGTQFLNDLKCILINRLNFDTSIQNHMSSRHSNNFSKQRCSIPVLQV